jgi:diphthamide synthase subunit DPH2
VDNAEDYYRPIITPIELNYALSDSWTGQIELGFADFEMSIEG